jgi:hypothetical protein
MASWIHVNNTAKPEMAGAFEFENLPYDQDDEPQHFTNPDGGDHQSNLLQFPDPDHG